MGKNPTGYSFTFFKLLAPNNQRYKNSPVSKPDAVVDVGTVVVKLGYAAVADPAMFGSKGSDDSTGVTEPENVGPAWTFPLVIASYLLDGTRKKTTVKLLGSLLCPRGTVVKHSAQNPTIRKDLFPE
jgi:hypothetical protein